MRKHLAFSVCVLAAVAMAVGAEARPKKRKAAVPPPPVAAGPSSADLNRAQLQGTKPATPAAVQDTASPAGAIKTQAVPLPEATILIRSTLAALQQANDTGDYSVLYALGSKTFQQANPPETLGKTFAPLQPYNISSVLVLNPTFTRSPVLTEQGVITQAGYFLNDGFEISFDLTYVLEDNHWKLFTLSAGLKQVGDAAKPAQ